MARITSQQAVEASGGNRYLLVLMASQRTKELINGSRPKIETRGESKAIIALKEIEQGVYTRKEYFETLDKKGKHSEHFSKKGKRHPDFDLGNDSWD
jgi:DNA-directed RNA polymerase omega subunit